MKQLVERALARLWGPRWNAIARAEFLRNFSGGTILSLAIFALLMNGAVIGAWIWVGPAQAGGVARLLACLSWLIGVAMTAGPLGQVFVIDEKLGTTEGWLLTSAPRQKILWARLAGQSAQGPLLILGLFPVYCVAAASLGGAFCGLFVCGHLARACGSFGPIGFTVPSVIAAAPLALMAVLTDAVCTAGVGASSIGQAVQKAGARGMFLSQPGQWFHWYLATFMDNLALMLMALLVEGGAAAVSGLAAYWMATSASLPVWIEAVIGLALALVLSALLVERRLALAATNIKFAADRFDEALIRDEPADG